VPQLRTLVNRYVPIKLIMIHYAEAPQNRYCWSRAQEKLNVAHSIEVFSALAQLDAMDEEIEVNQGEDLKLLQRLRDLQDQRMMIWVEDEAVVLGLEQFGIDCKELRKFCGM
jgi:hypothetical protein